MITFLTVILIVSAVFLVIVILMQQGKGQEMGAVFGGSSQTVFGASGAGNFLTKLTAILAVIFMASAFFISYLSASQSNPISIKSYIQKTAPVTAGNPATPAKTTSKEAGSNGLSSGNVKK